MRYPNAVPARFIARPNRFIARVEIEGREETVHVKNTGRCRELLIPGARVILTEPGSPGRRTRYDLIAVYRGDLLVNMDSQAPNRAAGEYLRRRFPEAVIRPEYTVGDSRLDYYVKDGGEELFIEVKGVTLFHEGRALFPDAPTERGVKHLRELIRLREAGKRAMALFIIQAAWQGIFSPNDGMHPAFGAALREAAAAGVEIFALNCAVGEDFMAPDSPVPVEL